MYERCCSSEDDMTHLGKQQGGREKGDINDIQLALSRLICDARNGQNVACEA